MGISFKLQILFCFFFYILFLLMFEEPEDENELSKNSAEDSEDDCIIEETHSGMTTRFCFCSSYWSFVF